MGVVVAMRERRADGLTEAFKQWLDVEELRHAESEF
jgi:hypothetical protein